MKQLFILAGALVSITAADAQTRPQQADRPTPGATAPNAPSQPIPSGQAGVPDRSGSSIGTPADTDRKPTGPIPTPYANGIRPPWAPH